MDANDFSHQLQRLEARQLELMLQKRRMIHLPLNWLAGAFLYGIMTAITFKLLAVWAEGPASLRRPATAQDLLDAIQPMHVMLLESWPGVVGGMIALAVMYLALRLRFAALPSFQRNTVFVCCCVAFALGLPFCMLFLWEPALPAIQAVFELIRNR